MILIIYLYVYTILIYIYTIYIWCVCFVLSHKELNTLRQADMTLLDQIFSKERTLSTSLAEKAVSVCRKCHGDFYGGNDTHICNYIYIYVHTYIFYTYVQTHILCILRRYQIEYYAVFRDRRFCGWNLVCRWEYSICLRWVAKCWFRVYIYTKSLIFRAYKLWKYISKPTWF